MLFVQNVVFYVLMADAVHGIANLSVLDILVLHTARLNKISANITLFRKCRFLTIRILCKNQFYFDNKSYKNISKFLYLILFLVENNSRSKIMIPKSSYFMFSNYVL